MVSLLEPCLCKITSRRVPLQRLELLLGGRRRSFSGSDGGGGGGGWSADVGVGAGYATAGEN